MDLRIVNDIFFKNFPYKLAALILTLVLWVFIAKEKNLEVGLRAKLIIKTRQGLVLSGEIPDEVNIRVVGPKVFLQPLLFRQLSINIDLSDSYEGEVTFNIIKSMIDLPWGVHIVSVSPSNITARLEKVETKTVPVNPVFDGNLPLGFSLTAQIVEPETVIISGPKNEINLINQINTKPIKLGSVTGSFTKNFNLELPSSRIILRDIKSAKVTLSVTESVSMKIFNNIKLEVFNCIFKCKLDPEFITVTLRGPKALLDTLSNNDIQVHIDAAAKPKGTYASKAVIKLPSRTLVEKVRPSWFKLTVF